MNPRAVTPEQVPEAMGRMLVPGLSFTALALGAAVELTWTSGRRWVVVPALGLVVANSLPLIDVQLVPEELRVQHRVRWNTRSFRTERQQWAFMRGNAERWARFGKALAQVTEPGDSLVLGAIRAVGYHSDLFIYDRFGLVTREVALSEAKRSVAGRSPGHDKEVSAAFFLGDEPTYLRAEVVSSAKAAENQVRSWRLSKAVKAKYAPELREA